MNVQNLLEERDIPYTPSGSDYVVRCLNPEHEDRHPSMRIDQILGIFHCLSCGFKGNVFVLFGEPENTLSIKREQLKRKIEQIRSSSVGLSMPENYTPYVGNWRNIRPETYKKFRAFRSHQKEFLGRIVFPITDISGRTVVFQGRDETGTLKSKYYNYPKNVTLPLFPSVKPIKDRVILVEGLFDMLNLHDKDLTNAVCIFGVNTFSKEKLSILKMQGVSGLDIILDADEAGHKGSDEIKKLAESNGFACRNVNLKEGSDPGSLSKQEVLKLKRQLYGK